MTTAPGEGPALDPASLIEAAQARVGGLTDFGDETFHDRLAILSQMLEEARLDADGRAAALDQVSELLASRLRMEEDRRQNPGIEREQIVQPLIVTGIARSGTTMFHSLLAQDPASRAPRQWEVRHPSPPPGLAADDDPRIDAMTREGAKYRAGIPGLLEAHPYSDEGGLALTECESWQSLDLRNTFPNSFYRVPAMLTSRVLSTDFRAYYAFHRRFLQQLQFGAPPRRWALKGTQHHYHLEEVLGTYPDGIVLWIHRDPARVVPSMLELVSLIQEGITGRPVRRPAMARFILRAMEADLGRAIESPASDSERVCHVLYQELRADPIAPIRAIYERFDLPFSDEFAARMRAWQESNAHDRHGKFRYSLDDFDIDADDLSRRFAPYRERFGIPAE